MSFQTDITLKYDGNSAQEAKIDLYDVSQALIGFQRSLAITTHFLLNGEVITQAPSLKGASIWAVPPEEGSWKITAVVASATISGVWALGTAPKDTPLGHLVSSAYDYVVKSTLGFHVDYDKTLGQQFEEAEKAKQIAKKPDRTRLDSVIEKCQVPIRDMHRPIAFSGTATGAQLLTTVSGKSVVIGEPLNQQTYDHIRFTLTADQPFPFVGKVSSYNINTFRGRIYIAEEQRTIPFELTEEARSAAAVVAITRSLGSNALSSSRESASIQLMAFPQETKAGRLKGLLVVRVLALVA